MHVPAAARGSYMWTESYPVLVLGGPPAEDRHGHAMLRADLETVFFSQYLFYMFWFW